MGCYYHCLHLPPPPPPCMPPPPHTHSVTHTPSPVQTSAVSISGVHMSNIIAVRLLPGTDAVLTGSGRVGGWGGGGGCSRAQEVGVVEVVAQGLR